MKIAVEYQTLGSGAPRRASRVFLGARRAALQLHRDGCDLKSAIVLILVTNDQKCINPLKPNDVYIGRTAPLTSRRCILYIYPTNIRTEYFKHAAHSPFFFLSSKCRLFYNTACFVPVLLAFYIQGVLKFKCKIPMPKG